MEYEDTFEENNILFISLTNSVKDKIREKSEYFDSFIETNFPQDIELNCNIFHYKGKSEGLIGISASLSSYILLVKRSTDQISEKEENYFVCIDIQERNDFIFDDKNDYLEMKTELYIPESFPFRAKYRFDEHREFMDEVCIETEKLDFYKPPSLDENEEFKKWYAYLTLLEKLIDEKDFYFEADITYSQQKAIVDISSIEDKTLIEKIKKARNQAFLYYDKGEVDTSKPLHEWDEKNSRDKSFGDLKQVKTKEKQLHFDLDDIFVKKFKKSRTKTNQDVIPMNLDTNEFLVRARQHMEKAIKTIDHNVVVKKGDEINVANSIRNLPISTNEEAQLLEVWKKLSELIHGGTDNAIDKESINDTLKILDGLLPEKQDKTFQPPSKLILRVSYFRDQFQLKTLKKGLEKISRHPLKSYLFGNKKLPGIDTDAIRDLEIEYLSAQLNGKQKEAVKKALISQELFMIQGPPGTGKTEVISEIAYQEAIRGKKVLITSQANMAVDNAIQRLNHPALYPVRIIRKDYEPEEGESLPVEANIDRFYQNRIEKNLEMSLQAQERELHVLNTFLHDGVVDEGLVKVCHILQLPIAANMDLSDEDNKKDIIRVLNKDSNRQILEEKANELKELGLFREIQQSFLEELTEHNTDVEEEMGYLKSNYLKNVNIWGATLFETGKHSFKELHFDVVVVDEVSKAMPPELVLPILKADKLVLVGDHKQLPPIIKDVSLEDLAGETGISIGSLDFETTVFEKLIQNNPDNYVMLDTQYRMHPHIQWAIDQFYKDENGKGGLKCGLANPDVEKCHKIEDETFKNKHLIWLKTKKDDIEERPANSTSFINRKEIGHIETTLKFLNSAYKTTGKKPTVGVITFYGKQLSELRKLETRDYWKNPASRNYKNLDLRFGTVDRFQGQEKDIIIVSLVRNNKSREVGFAKKPHRVNVAFSRAKNLLVIVGNIDNFTFGRDEMSAKQYRNVFNIAKKFGSVKGI